MTCALHCAAPLPVAVACGIARDPVCGMRQLDRLTRNEAVVVGCVSSITGPQWRQIAHFDPVFIVHSRAAFRRAEPGLRIAAASIPSRVYSSMTAPPRLVAGACYVMSATNVGLELTQSPLAEDTQHLWSTDSPQVARAGTTPSRQFGGAAVTARAAFLKTRTLAKIMVAELAGMRARRAAARTLARSHASPAAGPARNEEMLRHFREAQASSARSRATYECEDHSWVEGLGHGIANVHFELRLHDESPPTGPLVAPVPRIDLELSGVVGANTFSARFEVPPRVFADGLPHAIDAFDSAWNSFPALMVTDAAEESRHEAVRALQVEMAPGGACRVTMETGRASERASRMVVFDGLCSAGCTILGPMHDASGVLSRDSWSVSAASYADNSACAAALDHHGMAAIASPVSSRIF